jgi:hypothetical protein
MQDGHEHQRDRLGEVQELRRLAQDRLRVTKVVLDVGGAAWTRPHEQGARVREHHGVVIDIDDAGRWRDGLRHLVHVVRGRKARADIEELPDARVLGEVLDRAPEEFPVLAQPDASGRPGAESLIRRFPVGREMVLPA